MSVYRDQVSAKVDDLDREQMKDILNYLIGWIGPGKIDEAIIWQAEAYTQTKGRSEPPVYTLSFQPRVPVVDWDPSWNTTPAFDNDGMWFTCPVCGKRGNSMSRLIVAGALALGPRGVTDLGIVRFDPCGCEAKIQ